MADDCRCFVQFSHPGPEHRPDRGGGKAWHRRFKDGRPQSHMRKFMQLRGQWIDAAGDGRSGAPGVGTARAASPPRTDAAGDRQSGALHAWGEWEPESELVTEFSPADGGALHPCYLWRPYYVPKSSYRDLHNTDPFIFGPRFFYSNCFQSSRPGLKRLGKGSVIAFGSSKKIDGARRWMLDTVLVVSDFKDYRASDALDALQDWAPAAFLDVTARPLRASPGVNSGPSCGSTGEERLRLYRGATPDDPVDGLFSFFPASPASGDTGFPRPLIDLPAEYFNPASSRSPKGLRRNRTPDELRCLWNRLVEQVRDAGLVLGTRADLPKRRR